MSTPAPSKAWNACEFCRKRKRSCDRRLPRCSTCTTKGVECDYAPTKRVQAFPPAYFLDHRLFEESGLQLPNIDFTLAPSVVDYTGGSDIIVAAYYRDIHWWMPIISKTRLFAEVLESVSVPSAELRLLVLAMKVLLWRPSSEEPSDARTRQYLTVKNTIDEAISAGMLTLRLLQAQVLLAIYEMGHAIYPAAYLSIGACARYAAALGVDMSIQPGFSDARMGDLEMEERRRTWWAILILDRCMQLGNLTRPLSTQNPTIESSIPSDDEAFDQGIVKTPSFTLADAPSVEMGMLARMSQAAFLLGKVYFHNQDTTLNDTDRENEHWQLDRTIRALLNVTYAEGHIRRIAVCSQTDLCFRALIALHDPGGSRTDEHHMTFTLELLKPIADTMTWDTAIFLGGALVSIENASPLLLSWAYQAAKIHMRLVDKYGEQTLWSLAQMKTKLALMARRWKAGEAYLKLLEMQSGVQS